jgi:hypothetical protein
MDSVTKFKASAHYKCRQYNIMLATRVSRKCAVTVANAYKFVHSPSDFRTTKGAYAVNDLHIMVKDGKDNSEDVVIDLIKTFKKESSKYYNLKTLYINAPYAIINGNTILDIMSAQSTLTQLYIDICSFHTPMENMWIPTNGIKLRELNVKFSDGAAFPFAGTHILKDLENNPDIDEISITNQSPHTPFVNISRKLRGKVRYSNGVMIKYDR